MSETQEQPHQSPGPEPLAESPSSARSHTGHQPNDSAESPSSTPARAAFPPNDTSGARASLRSRLIFVLLLSTALIFAGLFFHQKRIYMKDMSMMAGSVRQFSADEAQLRRWQTMVFQKQKDLRTADALVGLMAEPATLRVLLAEAGTNAQGTSNARGQAFLAQDGGKLALFTFDLPAPEAPQRYQVWSVDAEGNRSSLGLLSDDDGGLRSLFMASPAALPVSIEVSLEPQATTDTPAGTVVLHGMVPRTSLAPLPGGSY